MTEFRPSLLIRPYRTHDRAEIRRICVETADAGEPLENFFDDRELVADLVTRYYTDYFSDYSWVAEFDGKIAGYLTAAPDTRAFLQSFRWSIAPQAFIRAIGRGLLFRRGSWDMMGALIRRKVQAILPPFLIPAAFPAHLHIDVLKPARGRQAGRELMSSLIRKLQTHHIPGVHATVRTDNRGACAFFERMDFRPLSYYDETLPAGSGVRDVNVTVYGRRIS